MDSQVPVAFNVLVGVAAPLLWTAQNTYVGRSAAAAAKLLQEPTEKWTASDLVQLGDGHFVLLPSGKLT